MEHNEKVRDVMIPIEEHPRIPYNSTMGEALIEIRDYLHKGYRHVLVFDERFRLVSVLSLRDILKSMIPEYLRDTIVTKYEGYALPDDASLSILWQESFFAECKQMSQRPISEILKAVKVTVEADMPVIKALYLMLREDVNMLPVVEDNIVIGVIRMAHILDMVLKACEICEGGK
jgi:CBS domain-containing protein